MLDEHTDLLDRSLRAFDDGLDERRLVTFGEREQARLATDQVGGDLHLRRGEPAQRLARRPRHGLRQLFGDEPGLEQFPDDTQCGHVREGEVRRAGLGVDETEGAPQAADRVDVHPGEASHLLPAQRGGLAEQGDVEGLGAEPAGAGVGSPGGVGSLGSVGSGPICVVVVKGLVSKCSTPWLDIGPRWSATPMASSISRPVSRICPGAHRVTQCQGAVAQCQAVLRRVICYRT